MIAERCAGFSQRDHFSMGGRIGIREIAIKSAANDIPLMYDDGTNWDLA